PAVKGTGANGAPNELNAIPNNAQLLGALAPDEKSGDDKRRLGYEIHGAIAGDDRNDIDVYSFKAQGNTEVWIDIDRTSYALDTVVELIDADGVALAISDTSATEQTAGLPSFVLNNGGVPAVNAKIMQRDVFNGVDLYSTTPRDAGFRVFLPVDPADPTA